MADLPYSSRPLVSKAQAAACNLFALHPTLNNVRVNVSDILSIVNDSVIEALTPINGSITTINSNIFQNSQRLDAVEIVNTTQNTSITTLNSARIDHETRITNLENDPGGTGPDFEAAICRLSTINNYVTIPSIVETYRKPIQMSIALSNVKDVIVPGDEDVVAGYMNNTTGVPMYLSSIGLTLLTASTSGDFTVEMNVVDVQIVSDNEVETSIPYIAGRLVVPSGKKRFIMTRQDIATYILNNRQGEHYTDTNVSFPVLVIPDGSRVEFIITNCGVGAKGAVVNLGFIHSHNATVDPQENLGVIDTSLYGLVCGI